MAKLKEIAAEFCNSYPSCDGCPAKKSHVGSHSCIIRTIAAYPADTEDVISEMYHWYENRPEPVRTRATMFFELFPSAAAEFYYNVDTGKQIKIPHVCARHIFANVSCEGRDCKSCWLQPIPNH